MLSSPEPLATGLTGDETFTSILQTKRFLENRLGSLQAAAERANSGTAKATFYGQLGLTWYLLSKMARTPESRNLYRANGREAFIKADQLIRYYA